MNQKLLDYLRLLSKEDKKDLSAKSLKTVEEVGELAKVVLPYTSAYGTNHRFVEKEQILEEAVDTILCALSVAHHLDFTDEEIESMMNMKAEKWAKLQAAEKDLKYPLPYEIHVTVKPSIYNQAGDLEHFLEVCESLKVKPIVLDLQTQSGKIINDVMTSSKHFGNNASAYEESQRIKMELSIRCYDVLRVKIETVPWHPAAPMNIYDPMPKDCYFEAHIPVIHLPEDRDNLSEAVRMWNQYREALKLHISRNAFKKHEDGSVTTMITLRVTKNVSQLSFAKAVETIVENFRDNQYGWTVGKVHNEFSIYDTMISHDAEWLVKE